MVSEAEFYSEQDKVEKEKIEARNSLEGYLYNLKNSIVDKTANKISSGDKEIFSSTVDGALQWLEDNPNAEKFQCEDKQKEVESTLNPILQKAYSTSANSNQNSSINDEFNSCENDGADDNPNVEEVD